MTPACSRSQPVKPLDLHVADAVLARFLQRQLGAFEDELVVLVMTVHQHDLARTM